MSVADIGPKWPIYCLHFLPIMRWYWLPIPLRHRLLILCRYSLPMLGDKVDVDDGSIVIISTSSQSRASIALMYRTDCKCLYWYRRDILSQILVSVASALTSDVSETGREPCGKRLQVTTKRRGISVVNQLSFGVNRGCGQRDRWKKDKEKEGDGVKMTRSPPWD